MPHLSVLLLEGPPLAYHMAASLAQTPHVVVHCLSDEKSFARLSRYFTSFLLHERFAEPVDLLALVKKVVVRTGAKVVLPVSERSTRWLNQHRSALEEFVAVPPLPSLETFEIVSDKRRGSFSVITVCRVHPRYMRWVRVRGTRLRIPPWSILFS